MSINLRAGWQGTRTEGGTLQYTHPDYPFKITQLRRDRFTTIVELDGIDRTRIDGATLHAIITQLQDLADAGQLTTKEATT